MPVISSNIRLGSASLVGIFLWTMVVLPIHAQSKENPVDKFRQLEEVLPTPNDFRIASGAPGPAYWQQRVDYDIAVTLDDENQRLTGRETITYYNVSPDPLRYLWVQLDQNRFKADSPGNLTATTDAFGERVSFRTLEYLLARRDFQGGYTINEVSDADGEDLPYTINQTMMRIDLPELLPPGATFTFNIAWENNIVEQDVLGGRGGFEYFEDDDNYLYEIAQWFPRLAAYTDVNGWHHKQFIGNGEFTLEFGNYRVAITAPADHVVASTGVLQNPKDVLTRQQRKRLEQAETAEKPVLIITPDEAEANESSRATDTKTWVFEAENVRDFAWASSRKFIWDARGFEQENGTVMAMSYYPKEGNPLWEKYSTHAIIHTLEQYNKYSFVYPYPVAISVNGPVGGMEYPMICFNGPRPEEDGTYSLRTKYGLISVIIHEVGHFYFPMIVNSDERQWTWMDEGINTFLQFLTEQAWEENYPSRRGLPEKITTYMASSRQMPIMTNSESLLQFGNNAYGKPATALNILRETIMGRELFDFAFREYAQRWKFKRPQPADFFRTMEDASAVDLDWFWRGWFYSTDHVDLALTEVARFNISTQDPDIENAMARERAAAEKPTITELRNQDLPRYIEDFPELADFYNETDAFTVTNADRNAYTRFQRKLDEKQAALMAREENFYILSFENIGGLVMPIILGITFTDGSESYLKIPAEIWRRNHSEVSKLIITEKEIQSITLDPHRETADVDMDNNFWPPRVQPSRFELYKRNWNRPNRMQRMNEKLLPELMDDQSEPEVDETSDGDEG